MGTMQNRMQGGLSAEVVRGICGGTSTALVAAGSAQADALELKMVGMHAVATAAASTGVRIPTGLNAGEAMELFNGGANDIVLYPPVGGTINNIAANSGLTVPTTKSCRICVLGPLTFFVVLGA